MLSNTTLDPSGEIVAKRGMLVVKLAGETSTVTFGTSALPRVSAIRNGITAAPLPSAFTRRILPPAQNTIDWPSGVQSMLG